MLLPIILILTLEILQRRSDSHQGLGDVDQETLTHYI